MSHKVRVILVLRDFVLMTPESKYRKKGKFMLPEDGVPVDFLTGVIGIEIYVGLIGR
jgi:hypothetical protein